MDTQPTPPNNRPNIRHILWRVLVFVHQWMLLLACLIIGAQLPAHGFTPATAYGVMIGTSMIALMVTSEFPHD